MAGYIRHGVNCEAVVQPNSTTEMDVYGNSFENWCADYIGHDVDNTPVKTGCFLSLKNDLFEFHDVDNNPRVPSPYVKNPLIKTSEIIFDHIPDDVVYILGAAEDRDITIFVAGNQQYLRLEDNTQILPTAVFS